ncbi:exonuclease domain-containing protein [Guptibacillus hwajinpoensis]|uniref:DNA polymerase-3 subunit epsilon n=1 Tax=Guptibacillus hwajinpoensis TaxID=208199 RepID=A0ABU0JZL4_9BACL|nr:exonuclease domain-containing protein [Alkalihalobacillus hemicentroti]MDQ0482489.1 DNA polymerase-3 subunit epsilon [Alkalihalobacillus hemicentroti]
MRMNHMIHYLKQLSGKVNPSMYASMQDQSNPHHISMLRQMQKEMKMKNTLEVPLNELRVVVFDLETTGFYPNKGDAMLSIGAVKVTGETIENDTFYSLVQSSTAPSDEVTALTGITVEDLESAPALSDVLARFYQFMKGHTLVAHHAKHEQAFMQHASWSLMRSNFDHRIVDTSFLIRIVDPKQRGFQLEDCCTTCGVEVKDRHHALGDAKMTAELWCYYVKKVQELGFTNLREVYERVARMG